MSTTDEVFIATDQPLDVVVRMLETAFRRHAEPTRDTGDPCLTLDTTDLFLHSHGFPDDEDAPLRRYPYMVEVRDVSGNLVRQARVAHDVFEVVKRAGWPALRFHDMQAIVEAYDPGREVRAG